jgi:predicted nucleic acid-binding protein
LNKSQNKKNRYWLDTNIIIRFVTGDHPTMSPEVTKLMQHAEDGQITLKVSPQVIAECCWVLRSARYGFSPMDISRVLSSFVLAEGIETDELDTVLYALDRYAITQVDFIDAYLAALSITGDQDPVVTFNIKDFRKLNVACCQPSQVMDFSQ